MAQLFNVTVASETVNLQNGQGQVAFTASNVSGRALRGRAVLVAKDPTTKAWMTLSGEAEQDFAMGATKQFTVIIKASKGAKPGKYNARLDVVWVENPDEYCTEGPTISIVLQPSVAPKKKFPMWIIPVAAVLLIGIGVALWLAFRGKSSQPPSTPTSTQVSVPNITGMDISDANDALTKVQLKLGNSTEVIVTDTSKIDQVIKQDPDNTQSVDPGTAVNVEVGVALVQVPPIVGKAYKDAVDQLHADHLDVGGVTNTNQTGSAAGVVLSATPAPGNSVKSHQTVNMVVQESQVQVPPLGGMTFGQAAGVLANANLRVGTVTGSYIQVIGFPPRAVQQGVTAQSPAQGATVPLGSTVNLSFSGPSVRINRTLQYAITERAVPR